MYHGNDIAKQRCLVRVNEEEVDSVQMYLEETLSVKRLNDIRKWLWIAGLPSIARPLHEQISKGRNIVLTERADCHLVWQDNSILIKPMPEILLDYDAWVKYLGRANSCRKAACGFLITYLWLICHESDFHIAQQHHLLPDFVEWEAWSYFAASVYDHLFEKGTDFSMELVDARYDYGELRLSRLNKIYRLGLGFLRCDLKTLVHGYKSNYTTYQSFIQRKTAWLVTLVVYIGVVLTAMQVGLATNELDGNSVFDRACYGFTLFAILGPLTILGGGTVVLSAIFLFHASYACSQSQALKERRIAAQVPNIA